MCHAPPQLQNSGTHSPTVRALATILFPRSAVTKHHTLGSLSNRNVLSQSSGVWKFKIKVCADRFPLRAVREDLVLASGSLAYGTLRHSLVCRWQSFWAFTLSSLYTCLCLCQNALLFIGTQSYWIKTHLNHLILT